MTGAHGIAERATVNSQNGETYDRILARWVLKMIPVLMTLIVWPKIQIKWIMEAPERTTMKVAVTWRCRLLLLVGAQQKKKTQMIVVKKRKTNLRIHQPVGLPMSHYFINYQ